MSELLDLAARVEALRAPDRETDAAIARLFCHDVESDDGDFWWGPFDQLPERVPALTASIDAAITLVPKGWSWAVNHSESRMHSTASLGRSYPTNASAYSENCTPALALTAAALRARSAEFGNIGADGVQS